MAGSTAGEGSVLKAGIPRDTYLGISIAFILLTGSFVAIRFAVNARNLGKFLVDDYLAVLAVVFFGAAFGLDNILVETLTNPKTTVNTLAKFGVAVDVVSGISLALSKTPVLFLYIRFFGIQKWLKLASWITLGALWVLMLASIITIGVVCAPTADVMPVTALLKCSNWSAHNGLASGILSLVVDVIILFIPIPVIISLHLPTTKKIGLAVVFTTGLFAIGASAVSLRFKVDSLSGQTTDTSTAIFFTNLEWCIAVMVGCVPAAYSFWGFYVIDSYLYSKISTAFSNRSFLRPTSRSNRSKHSHGSGPPDAYSGENSFENVNGPHDWQDGHSLNKSLSRQREGGTTIVPLREVTIHPS